MLNWKQVSMIVSIVAMSVNSEAALDVGSPAPDIEVAVTGGETLKLSKYRGSWVVLFFYPKANTAGCTKEACSLRDGRDALASMDAVILGASVDDMEDQESFRQAQRLPYPLIADKNKRLAKAFDVMGFGGLMAQRKTFIIDPKGTVAHVFDKVDVSNHDVQVKTRLAELQAAGNHQGAAPAGESAPAVRD